MPTELEAICAEIIRLARDPKRRMVRPSAQDPTVWQPTTVENPDCGISFTTLRAWHFLADALEKGCALEEVELDRPPGLKGYVVLLSGGPSKPKIYIKVRLNNGCLIGRSFHYSTR
jgi:hypothetical protein